jgi:hypothetical protein
MRQYEFGGHATASKFKWRTKIVFVRYTNDANTPLRTWRRRLEVNRRQYMIVCIKGPHFSCGFEIQRG